MRSEFGRGYATCLLMFSFHEPRIDDDAALNARMREREPGLFTESGAAERWANGASDHLYDLVRPRRGVTASEWRRAKALQDRALDVGHGFRRDSGATPEEMHRLCDEARALVDAAADRADLPGLTFEDVWALDVALGLTPIRGEWACTEPMPRRG